MPQNLQAASPVGVLPQTLSTAFTEQRSFPGRFVELHDGNTNRAVYSDGVNAPRSMRVWKLTKRLKAADLATLKAFFESHNGSQIPFSFYDPYGVAPGAAIGSNYDPAGNSTTGRMTCCFTNQAWAHTVGIARTETTIEFKLVA